VRYKATLPVVLLLLVIGQMSGELCMARCEGMGTGLMTHACGMHGMAQIHCALCKHTSDKRASNALSAPETCSGQACNSVLGLVQNRSDLGFESLVSPGSINILAPPIEERARAAQFRDVRSTKSILPFDPLISTLRI
jgi:hypothetical protein